MGPSFRTVVTDLPRIVETGLCLPVEAVQARTVETGPCFPVDTGTAVDYSVEEVSCCVVDLVQWMLH